jgi:uncharacterized membrane protein YgdD (TMEM256/DUF423 family)
MNHKLNVNRNLLHLSAFLSIIAVFSSLILFLKGGLDNFTQNLIFIIAVQLNLFYAVVLFVLALVKREYKDQRLITAGWIFTLSILVFSGTAYFSMLSKMGIILFNTIGITGIIGLIVGWIVLTTEFYHVRRRRR